METIYMTTVTETGDELGRTLGLNRSLGEYKQEITDTAGRLAHISGLTMSACISIAYTIVSETVPEQETRYALDLQTRRQAPDPSPTSMQMLDGNLRTPTSYGRHGEINPQPPLPLEYWLNAAYNEGQVARDSSGMNAVQA